VYQAYYKFTGKPFRLTPDPGFFFASRGHKRALAYLRYGLKQDEGFVVITGAPGTGKTTLAKILLGELNESQLVVANLSAAQVGVHGILPAVANAFGIAAAGLDKNAALKQLELLLLARIRERKRALLVIDDAHALPSAVLAELSKLAVLRAGDKALIQTLILARESFKNDLNAKELEPIRQKVIANFNLLPIASDEVERYVESRLSQVGWQGDPSFAGITFEHIFQFSRGIPKQINLLCDRILLYSAMEERHEITAEIVKQVIDSIEQDGGDGAIEKLKQSTRAAQERLRGQTGVFSVSAGLANKDQDEHITEEIDSRLYHQEAQEEEEKTLILSAAEKLKLTAAIDPRNGATGAAVTASNPRRNPVHEGERDLFRVIDGGRQDPTASARTNAAVNVNSGDATLINRKSTDASAEDVVLRRILRLVLAFHRSPSRFPGMDSPNQPLPEGITELLELAVSDDEVLNRISPAAVMGISPVMLRAAVRFFVRRALLVVDADDYRVLGLPTSAEQGQIRKHYDLLSQLLKQDKQRGTSDSMKRISDAYKSLLNTDTIPEPGSFAENSFAAAASTTSDQLAAAGNTAATPINPMHKLMDDKTIIIDDGLDLEMDISLDADASGRVPSAHTGSVRESDLTERFNFEDAVNHKRMRYASQMAVLGLGATVFVVFLYIIQLGPESDNRNTSEVSKVIAQAEKEVLKSEKSAAAKDDNMAAVYANNVGGNVVEGEKESLSKQQQQSKEDLSTILQEMESASAVRAKAAEKTQKIRQLLSGGDDGSRASRLTETEKTTTPISAGANTAATVTAMAESAPTKATSSPVTSDLEVPAAELESNSVQGDESITNAVEAPQPRKIATVRSDSSRQQSPLRSRTSRVVAKPLAPSAPTPSATPIVAPIVAAPTPATRAMAAEPVIEEPTTVAANSRPMAVAPPMGSPKPPQQTTEDSGLSVNLLRQLEGSFSNAYQAGNIDRFMQLFSVNAQTNSQDSLVGIRQEYLDLFRSTRSRKMNFENITWKVDGSHAQGDGRYSALIMPNGTVKENLYKGKVTLHADLKDRRLRISSFYFTSDEVQTTAASTISSAELNRFVNKFVFAYENGRLDELMSLFAKDARTNDQTSAEGIRKDHQELFSTTAARQMFLKNMNWVFSADGAEGNGDFEVLVQPKSSSEFASVKGKIVLAVRKIGANISITKMLHNVK